MTALAFLFAVFLARPCPFYILDEVEAALDDLNIDRFLDAAAPLLATARSSSSSPTRSARWRPPTRSTASRWAATASRRSSAAGSRRRRPRETEDGRSSPAPLDRARSSMGRAGARSCALAVEEPAPGGRHPPGRAICIAETRLARAIQRGDWRCELAHVRRRHTALARARSGPPAIEVGRSHSYDHLDPAAESDAERGPGAGSTVARPPSARACFSTSASRVGLAVRSRGISRVAAGRGTASQGLAADCGVRCPARTPRAMTPILARRVLQRAEQPPRMARRRGPCRRRTYIALDLPEARDPALRRLRPHGHLLRALRRAAGTPRPAARISCTLDPGARARLHRGGGSTGEASGRPRARTSSRAVTSARQPTPQLGLVGARGASRSEAA